MIAWIALLLATASQAGTPAADCSFEAPPPNRVAIQHARPSLCFSYVYPVLAAPGPALADFLRRDADRRETEAIARLEQSLAELPDHLDPADMPPHSYELGWSVSAETAPLLVMDAGVSEYSGGAHEGLSYETLLWDRAAGRRIAFADLFVNPRAAYRLLKRDFCAALLAMQIERGHTAADTLPCPELAEQPITLVGEGGPIRRATALLAPYVAGSRAEGPYEVDVPLRPALLRLIKARYRGAFQVQ